MTDFRHKDNPEPFHKARRRRRKLRDYEALYEKFWKPICEKDGKLDPDAVKRELSDYYHVATTAIKVYDALTNGKITKPNTTPEAILAQVLEELQKDYVERRDPPACSLRDWLESVNAVQINGRWDVPRDSLEYLWEGWVAVHLRQVDSGASGEGEG